MLIVTPPFHILPSRGMSLYRIACGALAIAMDIYLIVRGGQAMLDGTFQPSDLVVGAIFAALTAAAGYGLWAILRELICFRGARRLYIAIDPERLRLVSLLMEWSASWSDIDSFEIERVGGIWDFVVTVRVPGQADIRIAAGDFASRLQGRASVRAEVLRAFLSEARQHALPAKSCPRSAAFSAPYGLVIASIAGLDNLTPAPASNA